MVSTICLLLLLIKPIKSIQFLSRSKASSSKGAGSQPSAPPASTSKPVVPDLTDFLKNRDYTGAIALIQHHRASAVANSQETLFHDLWLAYCHFHMGQFDQAIEKYDSLLAQKVLPSSRRSSVTVTTQEIASKMEKGRQMLANMFKSSKKSSDDPDSDPSKSQAKMLQEIISQEDLLLYKSCCLFFLARDEESAEIVDKLSLKSPIRNRLLVLLMAKRGDKLSNVSSLVGNEVADHLCLAAVSYIHMKYNEAIEIYKKVLTQNRNFIAVNVYIALCYYKLDYYDVSQEILSVYLKQIPDSVIATNLKACNHYRLYNGKAAESELRSLIDSSSSSEFGKELIRHNLVVFRNGEGALQTLPELLDLLPEARLNLCIYHLRCNEQEKAFDLIKDMTPVSTNEFIVSAVVHAIIGQEDGNREYLKLAQKYFQNVGGSTSECDTIPGRQCMASCFFLMGQYDDVILYLSSIKSYFYNDDAFNFNYGQVKAATGKYKEALECLNQVRDQKILTSHTYLMCITRCNIMCRKPEDAWATSKKVSSSPGLSFQVLTLLANDCYRVGLFVDAMKAFDLLEKMDQNPEYWEGKRGAAAGQLQLVIAKKASMQSLDEVLSLLRFSDQPQAEQITLVIKNWIKSQDEE